MKIIQSVIHAGLASMLFASVACGASSASDDEAATDPSTNEGAENEIKTGGTSCGGRSKNKCTGDTFCKYAEMARCGATDMTGKCEPKPTKCTREAAPVCGCDGKTYGNACNASAAGTSVMKTGLCSKN